MSRLGLISAVASVAGLTGIPISGALKIDGTWANGFGPLILFSGMTCAISGVMYGAARVLLVGWKLNAKA